MKSCRRPLQCVAMDTRDWSVRHIFCIMDPLEMLRSFSPWHPRAMYDIPRSVVLKQPLMSSSRRSGQYIAIWRRQWSVTLEHRPKFRKRSSEWTFGEGINEQVRAFRKFALAIVLSSSDFSSVLWFVLSHVCVLFSGLFSSTISGSAAKVTLPLSSGETDES